MFDPFVGDNQLINVIDILLFSPSDTRLTTLAQIDTLIVITFIKQTIITKKATKRIHHNHRENRKYREDPSAPIAKSSRPDRLIYAYTDLRIQAPEKMHHRICHVRRRIPISSNLGTCMGSRRASRFAQRCPRDLPFGRGRPATT